MRAVESTERSQSHGAPAVADRILAARLASGDPSALSTAYDAYGGLAIGIAHRVLRDSAMAEDVAQEVFAYLWMHPDRYDPTRGTLRSWVSLLAHRRSVDRVRKEQRRSELETRVIPTDLTEEGEAEERVISQWVCDRVNDALATLPTEQREILVRAYYGGRTYREVAADLALPEGTVKSRVRLALRHLNELLGSEFAENGAAWT